MADEQITTTPSLAATQPPATPSSSPASPPAETTTAPASTVDVVKPTEAKDAEQLSLLGSEPKPETKTESVEVKTDAKPEVKSEVKPEDSKSEKPSDEKQPETKEGDKAAEEKTAEAKDGEKPSETEKAESSEQSKIPTYEPLKVPEGFKIDESKMGDFTKMLGEFEASKPDHVKFQEFGQKALDFHINALQEQTKQLTDYYVSLHQKRVADEFSTLKKDPVIGGNGDDKVFAKTTQELASFLQSHGGSKEEVNAFRKYVSENGVDNSLPIARVLLNLKSKIDRYESEVSKPLPGTKPATEKSAPGKGILKTLYGSKSA